MIPKTTRVKLHGEKLKKLCHDVWLRDGRKCIICGANVPEGSKPHHIPQGANKSDEPDKMVTLCYQCHQNAHSGIHGEVKAIKNKARKYLEGIYGDIPDKR